MSVSCEYFLLPGSPLRLDDPLSKGLPPSGCVCDLETSTQGGVGQICAVSTQTHTHARTHTQRVVTAARDGLGLFEGISLSLDYIQLYFLL